MPSMPTIWLYPEGDLLLKMEIAGHQVTFSKLGGAIHSKHVEHRVQMQTLSHWRQLLCAETNELMVDNSLQPTLPRVSKTHTHTHRKPYWCHCFHRGYLQSLLLLSIPSSCLPSKWGQQGVKGASHTASDIAPTAEHTTHLAVKKKNTKKRNEEMAKIKCDSSF